MTEAFDIDAWCKTVPGLEKAADGHWRSRTLSDVSYDESGHSTLAELEERSYWFNHRNAIIASMIGRHMTSGPLFDIGGGNGYVSLALQRAGLSPVVVEPGPAGVETARERGLPVIEAAFQDLDIPDNSLPAAGMFDVLEHIEDDRAALSGLRRALKDQGLLFLAVPAHQPLWSAEDIAAGHYRRYTLSTLRSALHDSGFEIVDSTYFFKALIPPMYLLRSLPYAVGLTRGDYKRRIKTAHDLPRGPVGAAIGRSFRSERARVDAGGRVFTGTSLFVSARSKDAAQ